MVGVFVRRVLIRSFHVRHVLAALSAHLGMCHVTMCVIWTACECLAEGAHRDDRCDTEGHGGGFQGSEINSTRFHNNLHKLCLVDEMSRARRCHSNLSETGEFVTDHFHLPI